LPVCNVDKRGILTSCFYKCCSHYSWYIITVLVGNSFNVICVLICPEYADCSYISLLLQCLLLLRLLCSA